MMADGLPIPARLFTLIERGLWPRTQAEALRQNINALVSKERIQLFAPEEDRVYLLRPPFHTVAELRRMGEEKFWSTFGAPDGISPDLAVAIASFGLGSDSSILLDYREDKCSPSVIRLKWRKALGLSNVWVRCADSFEAFADMLGLDVGDSNLCSH